MGHRVSATALAVAALVLITGCGSKPATSAEPSGTAAVAPTPSPTPAANAYTVAVMRTRGLGTASATITAESRIGTREQSRTATGGVDLHGGYGNLVWTDASGSTSRELTNGMGLFLQSPAPDGDWVQYKGTEGAPTGRLTDVMRGLGTLGRLRPGTAEEIDGQVIQPYTGRDAVTEVTLRQVGIDGADARTIAAEAGDDTITVTVWIDPAGRVVRIDRVLDIADTSLGPVTATTTTQLADFSAGVDLSPPPSESVSLASASS